MSITFIRPLVVHLISHIINSHVHKFRYLHFVLDFLNPSVLRFHSFCNFSKPFESVNLLNCLSTCIVLKGWLLLSNALRHFQDLLGSPEFGYYYDLNMPIKFCSEAYFLRLEVV